VPPANAREIEARRLTRAVFEALARCDVRLKEVIALPYGAERTALLATARDDASAALQALETHRCLGITVPKEDAQFFSTCVCMIEPLLLALEEFHPRAEA
jgi:hypothetical protein